MRRRTRRSPFQRTATGFSFPWPTEEIEEDEDTVEEEDEEPLVWHRARGPSDAQAKSMDMEQEEPLQETPSPPVKPAPACTFHGSRLNRKLWGSRSDDEE